MEKWRRSIRIAIRTTRITSSRKKTASPLWWEMDGFPSRSVVRAPTRWLIVFQCFFFAKTRRNVDFRRRIRLTAIIRMPAQASISLASEDRSVAFPLHPLQQGMLFHAVTYPGSGIDIVQVLCDVPDAIDADSLSRTWQILLDRHDGLRVGFRWRDVEQPSQWIQNSATLVAHFEDWSNWPEAVQNEHFAQFLADDRCCPFDLEKPPLLRVACFRLSGQHHRLVVTHHHIILDGRSFRRRGAYC
jgi:hypothetical protein